MSFTNFSAGNYIHTADVMTPSPALLSTGKGTLSWTDPSVNGAWVGNCHLWTAADSNATVTAKTANELYEVSTPDKAAGEDLVYNFKTQKTGAFCAVTSMNPISCAAIISDKIGDRARKDGSSSGAPFVRKNADGTYTAGINDAESGLFIYTVTVQASGDACTVSSIHKQPAK